MKNLGFLFVMVAMSCGAGAQSPAYSTVSTPNIYQKWVNEDVAYIATPEERSAFVALKADAERDEFVRQFWLRRDPTPGTEKDEFKEEHYRRIAYSNVHFAEKSPGWKTDRGRTYIVLGPPDEISAGKNSMGVDRERWTYKALRRDVMFEDRCRCGQLEKVK
jgi:GWxTD domain-containing protein